MSDEADAIKHALALVEEVLLRKGQDYDDPDAVSFGSLHRLGAVFGIPPERVADMFEANKMERIRTLLKRGGAASNEPLTDSYLDKAGYAIIALAIVMGTAYVVPEQSTEMTVLIPPRASRSDLSADSAYARANVPLFRVPKLVEEEDGTQRIEFDYILPHRMLNPEAVECGICHQGGRMEPWHQTWVISFDDGITVGLYGGGRVLEGINVPVYFPGQLPGGVQ